MHTRCPLGVTSRLPAYLSRTAARPQQADIQVLGRGIGDAATARDRANPRPRLPHGGACLIRVATHLVRPHSGGWSLMAKISSTIAARRARGGAREAPQARPAASPEDREIYGRPARRVCRSVGSQDRGHGARGAVEAVDALARSPEARPAAFRPARLSRGARTRNRTGESCGACCNNSGSVSSASTVDGRPTRAAEAAPSAARCSTGDDPTSSASWRWRPHLVAIRSPEPGMMSACPTHQNTVWPREA
jgi:hypothetical protein